MESRHCFYLNLPRALPLDTEPTMISTSPQIRFVFTIQKDRWQIYFFSLFWFTAKFYCGAEYGQKFKDGLAVRSIIVEFLNWVLSKSRYPHYQCCTGRKVDPCFKKLDVFTGFVSNTNNEVHNGGVDTAILVRPSGQFRINVPVALSNNKSRYEQQSYFCTPRWHSMGKLP